MTHQQGKKDRAAAAKKAAADKVARAKKAAADKVARAKKPVVDQATGQRYTRAEAAKRKAARKKKR